MNMGHLALPLICLIAAWRGARERCVPPYPLPPVPGGRAEPEVIRAGELFLHLSSFPWGSGPCISFWQHSEAGLDAIGVEEGTKAGTDSAPCSSLQGVS